MGSQPWKIVLPCLTLAALLGWSCQGTAPTPTFTPEPTPAPTTTPTPTAVPTSTTTPVPTPFSTATPTAVPTPTPSPSPTVTPAPQPTKTYRDERLGLTFSYPGDWTIDASDPTLIRLDPGFDGFVMIQGNMNGPATLESQFAQIARVFSKFPKFREISRTLVSGGAPGYLVSMEWSAGDTQYQGDYILTVRGARVFFLWAAAPKGLFDRHRSKFRELAASFEVTADPTPDPINAAANIEEILEVIGERVSQLRQLPEPAMLSRKFMTREEFALSIEDELLDKKTRTETELLKDLCVVLDLCAPSDDLLAGC